MSWNYLLVLWSSVFQSLPLYHCSITDTGGWWSKSPDCNFSVIPGLASVRAVSMFPMRILKATALHFVKRVPPKYVNPTSPIEC